MKFFSCLGVNGEGRLGHDYCESRREPIKAFAAFQQFLSLGPLRSAAKLAWQLGLRPTTIYKWAGRYRWKARAEEYDLAQLEEEQRLRHRELEQRAVNWAKRQEDLREAEWETSHELIKHAREILDNPRVRCTFLDAVRALELASTLGRRATGLSLTPEQEKPQKLLPWQHVSEEETIRRIQQVYGPASRAYGTDQTDSQPEALRLHSPPDTIVHCQNRQYTIPPTQLEARRYDARHN